MTTTPVTKHLAFVSSSFEYTRGIFPVAQRLEQRGYTVSWISFRGFEHKWLRKNGVRSERILDTFSGVREGMYSDTEVDERLARLENGTPPFINDVILMDRLVKRKPDGFARAYLAHIERRLTAFLLDNNVTLVSAGRDTALQISCAKICHRLRIPSVVPTVTRIPEDRFGFCVGFRDDEFVRMGAPTADDRLAARDLLRTFRAEKPIPATILVERKNNQFLRRIPKDFRLWFQAARRGASDRGNDFTRYTLAQLLRMYARRRFHALHVKLAPMFEPTASRPFVLYAYQMQPESSVDVLANAFSDQMALITQIARAVPSTHDLYVKPHPDHVGGLSRGTLLKLKALPGVRLIDPFQRSHDLMLRSSLVATPSGTMAFEAALHGVPSIVFCEPFFAKLPTVTHCDSPEALPRLIRGLITNPPARDDGPVEEFLAQLLADTFPGRVTDYFGPFVETEVAKMIDVYDLLYDRLYSRAPFKDRSVTAAAGANS
jgi:hypothetical protein